jgi:translocator protein
MIEKNRSLGKWLWPIGMALLCLTLGTLSGLSTIGGDDEWYKELIKPPGTPPPWVFGPVWTVLYLLMGISVGRLIHRHDLNGAKPALWVFTMQFVLNLMWTPIFFGMARVDAALAIIVAMWLGVLATFSLAWKVEKLSALLLLPYLLWLSYAVYLNAGIYWLNY